MKNEKLFRTFECEMRAETNDDGTVVITGRPIVFNKETVICGMFREVIRNGALDGADLSDVLLLVNHNDERIPLARSRASKRTMTFSVSSEGVDITATLDVENNPEARAVNMATFVGASQAGVLGAFLATLGVVLPAFLIILLIASVLKNLMRYRLTNAFLSGVRPCVVGMILTTALTMGLSTLLGYSGGRGRIIPQTVVECF